MVDYICSEMILLKKVYFGTYEDIRYCMNHSMRWPRKNEFDNPEVNCISACVLSLIRIADIVTDLIW